MTKQISRFCSFTWVKLTENGTSASVFTTHTGVNLILDTDFKHMLKNQNDDKDDLRLFSIVIFVVESDSGVKWSLEMVPLGKKREF